MAQMTKFLQIARAYEEEGGGPCAHERVAREFYLGADTGDVGCLTCGTTWPRGTEPPEWEPMNTPEPPMKAKRPS